jgi:hypothetical protein
MPTTLVLRKESLGSGNAFLPLSGRLAWHESTPPEVSGAAGFSPGSAGWIAWLRYLGQRRRPLPSAFRGRHSPLTWALPSPLRHGETESLIALLHGKLPSRDAESLSARLRAWLMESGGAAADASHALQCLAWCHALPRLATCAPANDWWELLKRLIDSAEEGQGIDVAQDAWAHQLIAAELSLTLAWQLPEIRLCRQLAAAGQEQLSAGLRQVLDHDGIPLARYVRPFRPLLACWTRCRALASAEGDGAWNQEDQRRFTGAVRQVLRMTRHDGGQVLADEPAPAGDTALLAAMAEGHDEPTPDPTAAAAHSEAAQLAILRCDPQRSSPILGVTYAGQHVVLELCTGPEVLLHGPLKPQIWLDHQEVRPRGDWEHICWESDEDIDYLEIEQDYASGLRVQRQMLLARKDRFLLLADVVLLGERTGEIDYRLSLPLAEGISFAGQSETYEGHLAGTSRRALIVPLALNEWKADPRGGTFGVGQHGLELRLSGRGRALYAPLFLDLNPRRFGRPVTWRQLTVAENRQNLPRDTAVGYRVQIGTPRKSNGGSKKSSIDQWVIYRSLTGKANRTLLGLNIYNEFAVGRFTRKGEFESLLEIE